MSEADDLLGGTIDQYLISLARGLQAASDALSQPRVSDQAGGALPTYAIPRLDFELTTTVALTRSPAVVNRQIHGAMVMSSIHQQGMAVVMIPPTSTSGSTAVESADMFSRVSGSFVAIPANEGRPAVIMSTSLLLDGARKLNVSVTIKSATGEGVAGAEVHFNIDRDASTVTDATRFASGVVTTDAAGVAVGVLEIGAAEVAGATVMIVIDAGGEVEQILYPIQP
jgi:hypothetical protein